MLKDFISEHILSNLQFTPTESQSEAISILSEFISDQSNDPVFILQGYAGTGKTTLIASLVKTLKQLKTKTVLLAPTGRAAKVISAYSNTNAYTIHKVIYRRKSLSSGNEVFELNFNPLAGAVFIVDEASMISDNTNTNSLFGSGRLLQDLLSFVYNNRKCKLIIVGDTAQLPPVGLDDSPALNKKHIESEFLKTVYFKCLTHIVRQQIKSGILENATQLRQNFSNNSFPIPQFKTNDRDIISIPGNEIIDHLSESYEKNGIYDTIVITRSNKMANIYNQGIRQQILWHEEEISIGDYIMIIKNNYFWVDDLPNTNFIANGDIAEIISINKFYELYGKRFAKVSLRLIDYNAEIDAIVMLDTLYTEKASLSSEETKEFFYTVAEDYPEAKTKKEKFDLIKKNEFFNALQIKFAYAVTCHKAQGGQWKDVYVDHGYMPEIQPSKEMYRWMYTAFTRASERLFLVNFNKDFIKNG